ncbi:hypothetical protein BI315_02080 [Xanthomonas citri pv. citri]|nr:hypothetical protein AB890_11390 [Xanthomonas citri pv. citri]APR10932.1 hypothetical protein BI314_12835 [Xanthomonas citri pv. citri]APR13822.1 hypothetical protein BI315_02080 [Xanthomonas citri pv. citri]APR20375.1 hypothetical protein BI316_13455 [Xanthomonas citri pv. citri]APR23606.1 hypothetical protein BJD09_04515 [Xanthomonas citri pv. citri]
MGELGQRHHHHWTAAGLYLGRDVHAQRLARRHLLLRLLLRLGIQMRMSLLRQGSAVRAVSDALQCLLDGQIVLAVDGVQQVIDIWITSDGLAGGWWTILVLLASKVRTRQRWRRSFCGHGGGLPQCRRAIRVIPFTQLQIRKWLLAALHARLPGLCDAIFRFELLFEPDAQLAHGSRNLFPGVRIRHSRGRRRLLIRSSRRRRLGCIGFVLRHAGGAAGSGP